MATTKKLQLKLFLQDEDNAEAKTAYINLPAPVNDDLHDPTSAEGEESELEQMEKARAAIKAAYMTDDGFHIEGFAVTVITTTTNELCSYI